MRDGAIEYRDIHGIEDLPADVTDEQQPGRYRLLQRGDGALFGYAVPAHSWKRWFHPAVLKLVTARRSDSGFAIEEAPAQGPPLAIIGARACELAALGVQDAVLNHDRFADPQYAARRKDVFIVAAECGEARGTCFCASMGTGPEVTGGFDLALAELTEGGHRFVVRAGSDAGRAMLKAIGGEAAPAADLAQAAQRLTHARATMGRALNTDGLAELLQAASASPRWDDVATRCLGCASCTMVCPTCFCTTVEDTTDLTGGTAERVRRWDSCFTLGFSYVFGGPVRQSLAARYRQWLTHKFSSWRTQFGTAGCVGCGRCITWCPAGIDITAEAAAIRAGRPVRAEAHR